MYNYAAGVLDGDNFSPENVKDFTGFDIYETNETGEMPSLAVRKSDDITIIDENPGNEIVLAQKANKIINLIPFIKSQVLREIAEKAGCTFYTEEAGSTVYGDNRFIGIFSADGESGEIKELL